MLNSILHVEKPYKVFLYFFPVLKSVFNIMLFNNRFDEGPCQKLIGNPSVLNRSDYAYSKACQHLQEIQVDWPST